LADKVVEACKSLTEKPVGELWHATQPMHYNGRVAEAFNSWSRMETMGLMRLGHCVNAPRDELLIDPHSKLSRPFLRDVLMHPLKLGASGNDVVVLTNADIVLRPSFVGPLKKKLRHTDLVVGIRYENTFNRPFGRDLLACRASWLADNWHKIPDFLLGGASWDAALIGIARHEMGLPTTRFNWMSAFPECEIYHPGIVHRPHESCWSDGKDDKVSIYNRRLAQCWFNEYQPQAPPMWTNME
jgi:hypothetical protein